mgnify:CR=1 FL=1
MERKLGTATLAGVVAFVVIFFGLSSYADSLLSGRAWVPSNCLSAPDYQQCTQQNEQAIGRINQDVQSGYALRQNAILYGVIGAIIVAGLALVVPRGGRLAPAGRIGTAVLQPSASASQSYEAVKRLQELDNLKATNLISEEEYQKKRTEILNSI